MDNQKSIGGSYTEKSYTDAQGRELFTFVMSTTDIDRDNDIVDVNTLQIDNFVKSHNISYYQHDGWQSPIGNWFNLRKENGKLLGDVFFHELEDIRTGENISSRVKEYVKAGIIKTCSIGFRCEEECQVLPVVNQVVTLPDGTSIKLPKGKSETIMNSWDRGIRFLTNCELLECSIVDIPANQNAVAVKSIKSLNDELNEKLKKSMFSISDFTLAENEINIPEQVAKWFNNNNIALVTLEDAAMVQGFKSGRVMSAKNKEIIKAACERLDQTTKELKAFIIEEIDDAEEETDGFPIMQENSLEVIETKTGLEELKTFITDLIEKKIPTNEKLDLSISNDSVTEEVTDKKIYKNANELIKLITN